MPKALLRCGPHSLVPVQHSLQDGPGLLRNMTQERPIGPLSVQTQPFRGTVQTAAHEGHFPGQQFEHHHAQAPNIRNRAEISPPDLRCHVGGGSSNDCATCSSSKPGRKNISNAKIDDHSMRKSLTILRIHFVKKQDVLRLQILVNDSLRMDMGDCCQALFDDNSDPTLWQVEAFSLFCFQDLMKLSSLCMLHNQVDVFIVLVILEQPDDVRVVTSLQISDLLFKLASWHLRLAFVDCFQHPQKALALVPHQMRNTERTFSELLNGFVALPRSALALLQEDRPERRHVGINHICCLKSL
mmetsp:Transcript_20442/g.44561  ORF Transcript_20442/g.44561 Transcript_20442/m.44561 type:complete len:299 (-) Transcript_20442:69-965(-)